ncbi:unnamed protein product [Adineta ricciae]|uniref:Uncharacterized protein n=1 Tax=Adineta ricciae TaxID=249248 RepID=A0A816FJC1_ADIRI|nr:unnamed protein product [Adineta ricciae]
MNEGLAEDFGCCGISPDSLVSELKDSSLLLGLNDAVPSLSRLCRRRKPKKSIEPIQAMTPIARRIQTKLNERTSLNLEQTSQAELFFFNFTLLCLPLS